MAETRWKPSGQYFETCNCDFLWHYLAQRLDQQRQYGPVLPVRRPKPGRGV